MKNIILCCDGTENKLTINENTNVLHLYSCLKQSKRQIAYYNPGAGTIWRKKNRKRFKSLDRTLDSISGGSISDSVIEAYKYLMENYQEGDRIYLFGFSRGAYCVRMLAGLLQMYGLLHKGNFNHLRYILNIYYANDTEKWQLANKLKKRFARKIQIHFMGIWDTVVSIGNPFLNQDNFPYTNRLSIVSNIRHAISIDERRKHFKINRINTGPNKIEVWFPGVHSDVGGSYPEEGLSKISLKWMLGEASELGLILERSLVDRYLFGKNSKYPPPNYMEKKHNSLLHNFAWLVDFIPRKRSLLVERNGQEFLKYYFDLRIWPWRKINASDNLHESVALKIENDDYYNPKNILDPSLHPIVRDKKITWNVDSWKH